MFYLFSSGVFYFYFSLNGYINVIFNRTTSSIPLTSLINLGVTNFASTQQPFRFFVPNPFFDEMSNRDNLSIMRLSTMLPTILRVLAQKFVNRCCEYIIKKCFHQNLKVLNRYRMCSLNFEYGSQFLCVNQELHTSRFKYINKILSMVENFVFPNIKWPQKFC